VTIVNYSAVFFATDGEYVTDTSYMASETIEGVWRKIADMGSRWIFYPIPFVYSLETGEIADYPTNFCWQFGTQRFLGKKFNIKEVKDMITSDMLTAEDYVESFGG